MGMSTTFCYNYLMENKVIFITGASRGIGRAMALKFAKDGASIAIAAKTATAHPTLPGTIYTVADEIIAAGGKALPIVLDVRDDALVEDAINTTAKEFGGLDILINNASAISLTSTLDTTMKKFDLMHAVNARATFACSRAAIPHLKNSDNPHILTLSPPLNMNPKWFANNLAYTMSKYGMSMCTLGLAAELKTLGIAVNSLWPQTSIATMAIRVMLGEEIYERSRKPEIVADAAYHILTQDSSQTTGNFFVDEKVLRANGIDDFSSYELAPNNSAPKDFFLD